MENQAWDYTVTSERVSDPDVGVYDTFGIVCRAAGQSITLRDISPDGGRVAEMAEAFNRMGLAPEHFRDVVEDMLVIWQDGDSDFL